MTVDEVIASPAVVTTLTFCVTQQPCLIEKARVAAAVMLPRVTAKMYKMKAAASGALQHGC